MLLVSRIGRRAGKGGCLGYQRRRGFPTTLTTLSIQKAVTPSCRCWRQLRQIR